MIELQILEGLLDEKMRESQLGGDGHRSYRISPPHRNAVDRTNQSRHIEALALNLEASILLDSDTEPKLHHS